MRRFLGLCGAVAIVCWMASALRVRGDSHWVGRGGGLESRVFSWRGVRIHAYRAPADKIEVATGAYLDASGWMRREHARVAINGGYFDGAGQSMGLRVSAGRRVSPLRNADWGVFWIQSGRARIAHTRDFNTQLRPDQALQCGPRLVVAGKMTDLLPQSSRRSGVGIDGRGRVVVAVADGDLLLSDWAGVWAAGEGLACRDAINLDGGPSTQLAFQSGVSREVHESVEGGWPIPDALVIR